MHKREERPFAAFIGIDWADKKHDVCLWVPGVFVLFPVQPAMLARYRLAFTPSRAKDDPTDAELALEVLLRHPEKLQRLHPESAAMRSLRRLVEARRSLVEDRTRLTNRITSALKASSRRY
jgi:transposase